MNRAAAIWSPKFDKDDVEAVGLVKFDFLGLRTLTIIDWALQTINQKKQQSGEAPVNITTIPRDDAASYALVEKRPDHSRIPAGITRHEGADKKAQTRLL